MNILKGYLGKTQKWETCSCSNI